MNYEPFPFSNFLSKAATLEYSVSNQMLFPFVCNYIVFDLCRQTLPPQTLSRVAARPKEWYNIWVLQHIPSYTTRARISNIFLLIQTNITKCCIYPFLDYVLSRAAQPATSWPSSRSTFGRLSASCGLQTGYGNITVKSMHHSRFSGSRCEAIVPSS